MMCPLTKKRQQSGQLVCGTRRKDGRCEYPIDARFSCELRTGTPSLQVEPGKKDSCSQKSLSKKCCATQHNTTVQYSTLRREEKRREEADTKQGGI